MRAFLVLSFVLFFLSDTMVFPVMWSYSVMGPVVMSAVAAAEVVASARGLPEGINGLDSLEQCSTELISPAADDESLVLRDDNHLWRENHESGACFLATRFPIGHHRTFVDITRSEIEQCLEDSLRGKYTRNAVQNFLKPFGGKSYADKSRVVANILVDDRHPDYTGVKSALETLQKKAVAAGDAQRYLDRKIAAGCSVGAVALVAAAYAINQAG